MIVMVTISFSLYNFNVITTVGSINSNQSFPKKKTTKNQNQTQKTSSSFQFDRTYNFLKVYEVNKKKSSASRTLRSKCSNNIKEVLIEPICKKIIIFKLNLLQIKLNLLFQNQQEILRVYTH